MEEIFEAWSSLFCTFTYVLVLVAASVFPVNPDVFTDSSVVIVRANG